MSDGCDTWFTVTKPESEDLLVRVWYRISGKPTCFEAPESPERNVLSAIEHARRFMQICEPRPDGVVLIEVPRRTQRDGA